MFEYEKEPHVLAKEKVEAIGRECQCLPADDRERFIVEKMKEAVQKPNPVGAWEVHHLLRIPYLSMDTIKKLMEVVADTHVLEIDGFLSDTFYDRHSWLDYPTFDKGLEMLGKKGMLFAVFDHCMRKYGKNGGGNAGKYMAEAVRVLAGKPRDDKENPVMTLNRFAFVAAGKLSDDTLLDVIEALAEKECPEPLQLLATGTLYSQVVRETAQAALGGMKAPANKMGLGSIGVKVVDPKKTGRPSGKRKRMLN